MQPDPAGDARAAAAVLLAAASALRARGGRPPLEVDDDVIARLATRVAHLASTDPEGSHLAVRDQEVVGMTQAVRREDLWVLVHLFVDPGAQSGGVGSALLAEAWRTGSDAPAGMIGASSDPRAIGRYARLPGFALHPTLVATGPVRHLPPVPGAPLVRAGTDGDLALADRIDRALRRGPHGPDLRHLLDTGAALLVVDDRGYAVVDGRGTGPVRIGPLAATDVAAATALLVVGLAGAAGRDVQLARLTADQQWALRVAADAGLSLSPSGPLVLRGFGTAPAPYLADPALC